MKKKDIIRELEEMYALRMRDYEELKDSEHFDEAHIAFMDAQSCLEKMHNVKKWRVSPIEIASLVTTAGVSAYDLYDTHKFRNGVFKFEEEGTISSTGGRKLAADSFQRIKPRKI